MGHMIKWADKRALPRSNWRKKNGEIGNRLEKERRGVAVSGYFSAAALNFGFFDLLGSAEPRAEVVLV